MLSERPAGHFGDVDGTALADPFGAFLSRVVRRGDFQGPLSGLSVAVKDNIEVAGQPFTAGLPLFVDRKGMKDAWSVRALQYAGAHVVGLTATDAAGFGVLTPTVKNPVCDGYVVGGSSGGAAAAVAARFADIGLGTDTGGSIRIPAVCCGLLGFKPSLGRISTCGTWPLAPSFDTVGVLARDFATLESAASVLLCTHSGPPPHSIRLGYDLQRLGECDTAVIQAMNDVLSTLSRAGIQLREVKLPPRDQLASAHATVVLAEANDIYSDIWLSSSDKFPVAAQRAMRAAQRLSTKDKTSARAMCAEAVIGFAAAMRGVDAVLSPTLQAMPPRAGSDRIVVRGLERPAIPGMTAESCLANVVGGPALSIPCGRSGDKRFIGLTISAPRAQDEIVLSVGRRLDHLLNVNGQIPIGDPNG